jgi:hypothetical protein
MFATPLSPSAWLAFAAAPLMCAVPGILGIHVLVVFLTLAGRDAEAAGLLDAAAVLYPQELAAFAADLERLGARGLPVSGIAAHLARKRGKN